MTRKVLYVAVVLLGLLAPHRLCAQPSYNVPTTGSSVISTCNANICDPGGPSSNYPNDCDGYIVLQPTAANSYMSIVSGTYDMEYTEDDQYYYYYDYVKIYDGPDTTCAQIALLGRYGTLQSPITSTHPSGALTIYFHSDYDETRPGFNFLVNCRNYIPMSSSLLTGCSILWADPGGNSNYSNNQNITQTIKSVAGERLSISFTQFLVSPGDSLYVYDGNSIAAPLIGSYSGSSIPPDITSTGDYLTFRFSSNNSVTNIGWLASITCVSCYPASTATGSPCAADNIHPFCTDEEQYTYYLGTEGSAHTDFFGTSGYVGCLYSSSAPVWYYMRIDTPGDIFININGGALDVDFACWGPFMAASQSSFIDNLCCGLYNLNIDHNYSYYPSGNLVDCSYSASHQETCSIYDARSGDYYLLLITNWSSHSGVVTFSSTSTSTATTDCGIVAEVSNDGPYCEGDTIHLFCNDPQQGATYHWTGPGGWTSNVENPVIYPATVAMNNNTYTLVKTLNGVSSQPASTTITVYSPSAGTVNISGNTTVCNGSGTTLTATTTGNNGTVTYVWSGPHGHNSTQQSLQLNNVIAADVGTYTVTATATLGSCTATATGSVAVNVRQPQHQSYTVDTCANTYSWHGNTATHEGVHTWRWSHLDAYGCMQVDTMHLTMTSPSFTPPMDIHFSVPCARSIHTPTPPVLAVCNNTIPMQLFSTDDHINGGCGYFTYVYHYTVAGTLYTWRYTYFLHPSAFTVPANESSFVQCLADAVPPVPPVVINTCGDTIVPAPPTISNHSDGCSGYLSYSWLYKDCENHSKTWSYTYVVSDTTRPTFTVPADTYVCRTPEGTYNANPNITGRPQQVADNCSSLQDLTIVCQDVLHSSTGSGVDTLVRTWVVADDCDNSRAQTQRILIYPPDSTVTWDYICEGETYGTYGFGFIAKHDTIVYQHLQSERTGCDSVVKVFLTVWHPAHISDTAEACYSYTWHGELYTSGGIKMFEHLDGNGCRQVDTLHLTLYDSVHEHKYDSTCYQYSWDDNVYTVSGNYTRHFETVHGCDSAVTLHLTIFNRDEVEFVKQRCKGMSFQWYEHFCETDGDYVTTLQNVHGCDSVVTMHLFFQDTLYEDFDEEACDYYTWNDKTYYTTGDFEQFFHVWEGCDSAVTMHLTLYHGDTVSITRSGCEFYVWNDSVYTQSGNYKQHFFTEHGCDSLVKLNLTIHHNTRSSLDSAICTANFPFQWNGVTFYYPGGIDSTVIPNAIGCDSLITMQVTLKPNTSSVLYDTIVQNALPYDTLGMHFTATGSMQTTISNVYGCDSLVTMNLTVLPNVTIQIYDTVCENELPIRWNEQVFTQAGTQSVTLLASSKVDSTVVMHLSVNLNTYSTVLDTVIENNLPRAFNGVVFADSVTNARVVIPNAQQCDSVITYSLYVWRNVSHTTDSAVCNDQLPVMWNGVEFLAAGENQIVLTGAHGEDDTLLMRLHVNNSASTTLREEICMSDLPYRYINGQIDTTFEVGTPSLLTVPYILSTVNGCDSLVTLTLDVMDTSLHIVSSNDFCPNMYTTLSVVTSLEDYVWSTGETSAFIEVTEPGEYSVTASTGDCRGRAYRRIAPCRVEVRMPNAISPSNSDGLNDCMRLPEACLEQIESFEIKVFSRWGEMVFYSKDKNFRWYGDYKGHVEREEVYSYTIKYIDKDGIMFRMKGAITVL